jgi:hypothetical protein
LLARRSSTLIVGYFILTGVLILFAFAASTIIATAELRRTNTIGFHIFIDKRRLARMTPATEKAQQA